MKIKILDILIQKKINDTIRIKITDEALETHYINKFNILVADHPYGTEMYPTSDNGLLLVSEKLPIISAITKNGRNVTEDLLKDDDRYYRSGVENVLPLKKGPSFDWIDLKLPASKKSNTKLVLKYRNTLLSTTLLYNVVIGSQGLNGTSLD